MNILVTLNSGYIKQLTVMLHSLIQSNPNEKIFVYIMNSSLTKEDFQYIKTYISEDICKIIDIKMDESILDGAPVTNRYPKEMYYRIFAAKFLPQDIDRILYLDPDLIVLHSLKNLYHMNLDGYFFAAASHVWGPLRRINKLRLKLDEENNYINSGVMLMNLDLLRKEQDVSEVFQFIEKYKKLLVLPDQDVISGLYSDKIIPLDPYVYNMTERLLVFKNEEKAHVDLEWVKEHSAIIHYCGRNKPWKDNYIGKLDVFYLNYSSLEPFSIDK